MRARFALIAVALGSVGCERGCLGRWLAERGAAERPGAPSHVGEALFGTDCSGGLVRCVGGRVEASLAGAVAHPCGPRAAETKHRCECAWELVGACPAGCAYEGLEVAASPDAGVEQLCGSLSPSARAPLPGEAPASGICADARVACVDGAVHACDGAGSPVRLVAVCLGGCHPDIGVIHGGAADLDGAVSVLCRRTHVDAR